MKAVRLMADWGLGPFYIRLDDGVFYNTSDDVIAEEFGVPGHVLDEVLAWDAVRQAIFNWDDPMSSDWARPEDEIAFLERGREVAALLRRHLPPDVPLEYCGADDIATEQL